MKYEAVIFDFDGVIAKTMEDNYRAWKIAFNSLDVDIGRLEYFLLEGLNGKAVAETILKRRNRDISLADAISALKEKYYFNHHTFELYPGIYQLVDHIRNRLKIGLVSGASSKRLKQTVPHEFLDKMEVVISGDAVRNSKPHQEPYLSAGKALSVNARNCLAVENAPLGIESAKEAGMDCVAVCTTLKRNHLEQADYVLRNIDSLILFFYNLMD
jgi:HAD superfamily hydrolase (TIGR01509 family)